PCAPHRAPRRSRQSRPISVFTNSAGLQRSTRRRSAKLPLKPCTLRVLFADAPPTTRRRSTPMLSGYNRLADRSVEHALPTFPVVPPDFTASALLTRRAEPLTDDLYRRDQPERTKDTLIGKSRALRQVIEQLNLVAATD